MEAIDTLMDNLLDLPAWLGLSVYIILCVAACVMACIIIIIFFVVLNWLLAPRREQALITKVIRNSEEMVCDINNGKSKGHKQLRRQLKRIEKKLERLDHENQDTDSDPSSDTL